MDGKGNKKTTKQGPSGTALVVTDAAGNEIKYHLGLHNLPLSIEGGGGTITTEYNSKLQRTQLCDPNTGCITYTYDIWGNLVSQTDAKGQQYILQYDNVNRLTRKYITQTLMGDIEEYTYNYFNTLNSTQINQLNYEEFKINGTTKHKLSYEYNPWGGLYKTIELTANSSSYTTEYGYDNFHRLTSVAYPNIALTYVYDNRNNLYKINTNNNTKTIWELTSTLPDGRTKTATHGNGYVRTNTYNNNLQLEGINDYRNANSSYALNYNYEYELTTGNLLSRTCNKYSLSESFQYDNLYRLTGINRGTLVQNIAYAANGNINNKFDAGAYLYESSKPHAVTSNRYQSSLTPSLVPSEMSEAQLVDVYTAFDKIQSLRHLTTLGVNNLDLSYGVNQERIEMQIQTNSIQTALVQYINTANMEIVNGTEITYIYADGNPIAMHRKAGGESVFYYLHTDVLGSLLAITDINGVVVEERNFDAWGRARNPSTWNYLPANPFGSGSLTMRGFTFHEHLDMFGLINMNGRMYDPVLGRMLSPDNFVQAPNNFQNFNRYSYCVNNPLKYTDPSGEVYLWDDVIVAGAGFAIGYVGHGLSTGDWGKKAVISGAIGAGTALLGYYSCGSGAIASGFANAGANGCASTVALGYAGRLAASSAISQLLPQMNFRIGNVGISCGFGVGFGAGGTSLVHSMSYTYFMDEASVSVGFGGGDNMVAWRGGFSIGDYGASYGRTEYDGSIGPDGIPNNQTVGQICFNIGAFSGRVENDFMGDGDDRWRSNAFTAAWGDVEVGTNLYNNRQKKGDPVDDWGEDRAGNINKGKLGKWINGLVYNSPGWVGYRQGNNVTKWGYSHPAFQDRTQNFTHRNGFLGLGLFGQANFFSNYSQFQRGPYMYTGYNNPFSLW